ncbi:DUF3367 domain-containing protein, partial [Actinomadura sp. GC306]
SGLAVACCGGINATATVAVLVVPFLYIVTRPRGSFRIRLLTWWSAATAAATAWWLVPLLLTGTYGFSWLTYTERAETTTGPTGLINVLRGAERWVNYLILDGQVGWPVGFALSVSPVPIICTGVVAALGLAGLLGRLLPERTFLLVTLLSGLAILSAGHLSEIPGPLAGQLRELLDGPLAPLRNLHKFDAVVRLPLALGLAHLLVVATGRGREGRVRSLGAGPALGGGAWKTLVGLPVVAAVAIGGIGVTAVSRGLSGPGEFREVPGYWRDAAAWINARAGQQGVLAVPGAPFGEYLWGRPMDDIVQPLLTARWGVRQLVPAGSPGYTRALDAIDLQVRSGQGSPGLSEFLARMGVRYVLVRNDLRRETLRGAWPSRVNQALEGAPGLRRVAAFGGPVGWDHGDAVAALDQPRPALEVFEVEGAEAVANLAAASDPVRVYGGPESLLAMADGGTLPPGPVLLDDDAPDLRGSPVVTDSPRLIRRHFGELHQTSPTLSERHRRSATDVLDEGWKRYATHVTYGGGVRDVTASSSAADEDVFAQSQKPGAYPYAALDGNQFTAWETGGWDGPVGQWLRIDFDQPRDVGSLTAAFVQNPALGPPVGRVRVETETGAVEQEVQRTALAQPLRAPEGATRWLRLRITGLASKAAVPEFARAAVAEVAIGGVKPTRTFTMPAPAGIDGPATYVMNRRPGARDECMRGEQRWVCSQDLGAEDEEGAAFDRTFTSAVSGKAPVTGTAVLTDLDLIARYTSVEGQPAVAASSAVSTHPAAQARSGFDGDPATTWIAAEEEDTPVYSVRWKRPTRLSSITLQRPPGVAAPIRIQIEGAGGEIREGLADTAGRLSFAPMTTDRLKITFFRGSQIQPVQLSDLVVPGVDPLPDVRAYPLKLRCGFGPKLLAGGSGAETAIQTEATGTLGDLLAGRPLRFSACKQANLSEGENRLAGVPLDPYRIDTATVGGRAVAEPAEEAAAPPPRPVKILSWGAGTRRLEVDAAAPSFLTVNENFNEGWTATVGGTELRPVRLDGWKQGWLVPAGTAGVVELAYGPDRAQRAAVVAGLNLLILLLIVAVWPARRGSGDRREPLPRPGRAPVGGTGWPAWAAVALAAALGGWVAGAPGLAVAAAVAACCGWARTRESAVIRALASPWTIALAMLAGTGCLAAGAWLNRIDNPAAPGGPLGDIAPQLLGLVVVGRIAAELWRPRPPGGDARGPIALSWTAPGQGPGADGPGGSAAAPDAPAGSSSPSPLRWSPPSAEAAPSPDPPGTPGPSPRSSRR